MYAMQTWSRRRLPDWWVLDRWRDPRFEGLNQIRAAIEDAEDLAWGSILYDRDNPDPSAPTIYSPLQLAAMLSAAAHRMEALTRSDEA